MFFLNKITRLYISNVLWQLLVLLRRSIINLAIISMKIGADRNQQTVLHASGV